MQNGKFKTKISSYLSKYRSNDRSLSPSEKLDFYNIVQNFKLQKGHSRGDILWGLINNNPFAIQLFKKYKPELQHSLFSYDLYHKDLFFKIPVQVLKGLLSNYTDEQKFKLLEIYDKDGLNLLMINPETIKIFFKGLNIEDKKKMLKLQEYADTDLDIFDIAYRKKGDDFKKFLKSFTDDELVGFFGAELKDAKNDNNLKSVMRLRMLNEIYNYLPVDKRSDFFIPRTLSDISELKSFFEKEILGKGSILSSSKQSTQNNNRLFKIKTPKFLYEVVLEKNLHDKYDIIISSIDNIKKDNSRVTNQDQSCFPEYDGRLGVVLGGEYFPYPIDGKADLLEFQTLRHFKKKDVKGMINIFNQNQNEVNAIFERAGARVANDEIIFTSVDGFVRGVKLLGREFTVPEAMNQLVSLLEAKRDECVKLI